MRVYRYSATIDEMKKKRTQIARNSMNHRYNASRIESRVRGKGRKETHSRINANYSLNLRNWKNWFRSNFRGNKYQMAFTTFAGNTQTIFLFELHDR